MNQLKQEVSIMISKEKLLNTYIDDGCGELIELYAKACAHYEMEGEHFSKSWVEYHGVSDRGVMGSASGCSFYKKHGRKQLILADFKPKVKVEYVSVNKELDGGKFWECARDFAEGDCEFFTDGDSALKIHTYNTLLANYRSGMLYRKVETELTWQDELIEHLRRNRIGLDCAICDGEFDNFSLPTLSNKQLIGICHLVASMTDKPE
jgi:hypothetical protein